MTFLIGKFILNFIHLFIFSDEFVSEVVIGDNHQRNCDSNTMFYDKKRHILQDFIGNKDVSEVDVVQDGILAASTNYTGYILIKVHGPNGTVSFDLLIVEKLIHKALCLLKNISAGYSYLS